MKGVTSNLQSVMVQSFPPDQLMLFLEMTGRHASLLTLQFPLFQLFLQETRILLSENKDKLFELRFARGKGISISIHHINFPKHTRQVPR